MIAQATGGTISVTGEKGRGPVKPGLSLGDTGTGMTMAISILGALHKRAKTGEGHRLQVAMQDAMLHYMRTNFSTQARSGKAVERDGTHSGGGSNAPSGLYPCAPGGPNDYVWIMTSRANPEHWARLCKVMGREELIADPRFAKPARPREEQHRTGCDHRGVDAVAFKHEAMAQVGGAGIPAGAVLDTMELQNEPTFEQRGIMQVMQHPKHGPFKMPAWPVRVDGKPPRVKPSPILGEHTANVLTGWLGLSDRGGGDAEEARGWSDKPLPRERERSRREATRVRVIGSARSITTCRPDHPHLTSPAQGAGEDVTLRTPASRRGRTSRNCSANSAGGSPSAQWIMKSSSPGYFASIDLMPSITWPGEPQNHAFCCTPSRSDGVRAGAPGVPQVRPCSSA